MRRKKPRLRNVERSVRKRELENEEEHEEENVSYETKITKFHYRLYRECLKRDRKRKPDRMII